MPSSTSRSEVRDPDTYCDVCGIQFVQRDTFLGHKRYYCGNARRSRAESALSDLVAAGAASASAAATASAPASGVGPARDPAASMSSPADPSPYSAATGGSSHPQSQSPHGKSPHSPPQVAAARPPVAAGGVVGSGAEGSGASQHSSQNQSPPVGPTPDYLNLNPLQLMQSIAHTLYSQTTRPPQLLEPLAASAGAGDSQSAVLEQLHAITEQLKLQFQGLGVPPTSAPSAAGATESSSSGANAAVADAHNKYQLPEALATGAQAAGGYPGVFLPGAPLMLAAPVLTTFGVQYYPVMQTPLTLGSLIAGLDSQQPASPSLPLSVSAAAQLLSSHGPGPGPLRTPSHQAATCESPASGRDSAGLQSRRSASPSASPLPVSRSQQQQAAAAADPNALHLQQLLLQSVRALEPLSSLFSAAAALTSKASPVNANPNLPSASASAAASNNTAIAFKQELLENFVSQHLRSHSEPQPLSLSGHSCGHSCNSKGTRSPPALLPSSSNRPLDLTLKPQQTPAAARRSRSRAPSECSETAVDGRPNAAAAGLSTSGGGASGPNLMEQLLKLYQGYVSSSMASDSSVASSAGAGLPGFWSQAASRAGEQLLSMQAASGGGGGGANAGGEVLPVLLQNSVFFMCTRCLVAFRDIDLLRAHKPHCSEAAPAAAVDKLVPSAAAALSEAAEPKRPSENKEAPRKESTSPKQQQPQPPQSFSCVCGIQFSAADSLRAHQTWYCSKTAALEKDASNAAAGSQSRHFRSRSEVRTTGAIHELHRNAAAADEASTSPRRHGVSFMETGLVGGGGRREENANGSDPKEEPRAEPSAAGEELEEVDMVSVKLFTCGLCSHSSRSLESFAEHIKCHPTIAQAVYYQCALCGYRGNTVRGLKIHGKAHCSAGGANFSDDQVQLMCRPDAIAGGLASAIAVPKEILQVTTRLVRASELEHRADAMAAGGRERDGSFGEVLSPGSDHHSHAAHRTRSRRSNTDFVPSDFAAIASAPSASSDSLECPYCHSRFISAQNRENHMRTVCRRFKRAMTVADNRGDACGAHNAMARKRTHTASTHFSLNLISAAAAAAAAAAAESPDETEAVDPNLSDQKPALPAPAPEALEALPSTTAAAAATATGHIDSRADKLAALKVCSRCGASFRNMSNYSAHRQFYCQFGRHSHTASQSHTASSVCSAAADEAECAELLAPQSPSPPQQRSCSECLVSPSVSEPTVGEPLVKRERVSTRSPVARNDCCPVGCVRVEVVAIEEAAADEASLPPPKRALQLQPQHDEADESAVWPRETRESSTSSASEERDVQRAARSPAHESVVDVCG